MTSPWAWLVLVAMAAASTPHIPPVRAVDFYADRYMDDDDKSGSNTDKPDSDKDDAGGPSCPELCVCYSQPFPATGLLESFLTVNCSGQGLVDFPLQLPNQTQVLDMANNKLQNLTSLPQLADLRVLDMSSNWMRHLDNQWIFEHVSKLRVLSLADNALQSLQHGTFSGLTELRVLDLSRNIIKRIEMHAFGGLNNLEILNLEKNQLYQLKREWFLSLPSLTALYLSNNYLATLESNTFSKLEHLQHLDLSQNAMRIIPDDALIGLTSLKFFNLSSNVNLRDVPSRALRSSSVFNILLLDKIALSRLTPFEVKDIGVVELSLSFLPRLRVVEKSAFHNLTRLQTLQLHDNPHLVFLHPSAFSSLPSLRHLFIHNNGLIAVSSQILTSLPSLSNLHLYRNPFHCDCNIYWLRKEISRVYHHQYKTNVLANTDDSLPSSPSDATSSTSTTTTTTTTTINTLSSSNNSISISLTLIAEPDRVACYFPAGKSNMPLVQLPISYFSPTCPPTTLPLFPAFINISLGDELWLECQGLGVPIPSVSWVVPGGQELNYSTATQLTESRDRENYQIEIVEETLLYIKSVTLSDSGSYGCHAVNSIGEDYSTTTVHVQNKPLSLTQVKVSNDYITVAWQGSIPRMQMSDFQLYYRELPHPADEQMENDSAVGGDGVSSDTSILDRNDFDVIFLHGSIHKCTITGLRPQTSYQVCLIYRQTHPVECHNYTTTLDVHVVRADGIVRISKTHIGVGVASVLGLLLLVGALLLVRKVRHRKDYQDPLAEEEKSSIPLEGLNSTVPSTPLTSSRTALLTNSQI